MADIKDLVKSAKKVLKASPNDAIGSALENVKSSHDPVFIYDGTDFLGLISASQSFFKKRYPLNTKTSKALIVPPKLTADTDIFDAARHMLSTKIYTLPVFDKNGNVNGIISARSLLESVSKSPTLQKLMKDGFKAEVPITTTIHSKIREIYSLLRKEQTSRIVIVEENGSKIKGILTRRDIQQVFTTPPAQGVSTRNKNNRTYIIDDRDLKKFDFPIAEFVNVRVITMPVASSLKLIINTMLGKNVNSVILVDKKSAPKGIVSLRTFLERMSEIEPEKKLKILFSDKHKIVDETLHKRIVTLLDKLEKKVDKVNPIQEVKITLDADKNPKGIITQYTVHLHVNFSSGKMVDTKVSGRNIMPAIRDAAEKISSQLKLNHKKKHH